MPKITSFSLKNR